jgi:hypothetical protein
MIVEDGAQWNFAYVMPNPVGHPLRIVVPSARQMGWVDSPSYLCAATETGRDVIAKLVSDKTKLPPHPLESHMHPDQPTKRSLTNDPVHGMYVNVDNYIGACVENKDGTLLGRISRAALHAIHSIFPSPAVTGHTDDKDPISFKNSYVATPNGVRKRKSSSSLWTARTKQWESPTQKPTTLWPKSGRS